MCDDRKSSLMTRTALHRRNSPQSESGTGNVPSCKRRKLSGQAALTRATARRRRPTRRPTTVSIEDSTLGVLRVVETSLEALGRWRMFWRATGQSASSLELFQSPSRAGNDGVTEKEMHIFTVGGSQPRRPPAERGHGSNQGHHCAHPRDLLPHGSALSVRRRVCPRRGTRYARANAFLERSLSLEIVPTPRHRPRTVLSLSQN